MTNETPNTPDLSETELRRTSKAELQEQAQDAGVEGADGMKKAELVDAISTAHKERQDGGGNGGAGGSDGGGAGGSEDGGEAGLPGDRGPDEGHLRTGEQTSRSLQYAQEITSLDEDPEREGRSLATTSHEVIRRWAEERGGTPATVEGTEHGDHLGVLRFDFGGDNDRLRHVSWDEWFHTFDVRELNFIYQEERKDGRQSSFFRTESPNREDG
jgi:Rho termination factor, N-terminal domain